MIPPTPERHTVTHRETAHLADVLARQAANVAAALDHIRRELLITDGYKSTASGASDGTPGGGDGRPTEAAMLARYELTSRREAIRDRLRTIADEVNGLDHDLQRASRYRTPADVKAESPRCSAHGMAGADVPYTPHSRDPRNGWSDPTCHDMPTKGSSLCERCLKRHDRWGRENDQTATSVPVTWIGSHTAHASSAGTFVHGGIVS